MTDPYGVKKYLEEYGSEDAKVLALIIYGNTEIFSMSAHEGMDALKRLADLELENYTMRQLVSRGYSFTFKSDGIKVTILDGNFYLAQSVLDAIYHLAGTFCIPTSDENPISCTDAWPDDLKLVVKNYLASQGLAPDRYENLGNSFPPNPDKRGGTNDECKSSIEYCVVEVDPHLLVTEGDPFGHTNPDDAA